MSTDDTINLHGPIHLHCPHCHNPIELINDQPEHEVLCPSCGSSFHLDADRTKTWSKDKLPKLGKFELIEVVGRGAFGTVYRAHDTQLRRVVACKVPRSGQLATDEDETRFVREARNAAQLQHPGIVPVYEVGHGDEFPYIVSEFVEGITLADALSASKFGFRESAVLVAQVAVALQHAHDKGVVHRDLKPSNIMLTREGVPRVMDFGLAKRDAGEITMTVEGQVLGTPAYMSPEQASGQAHHVDGRSDVYSLGVVLFELLSGELPFRGNQRMLLHQVMHDEPRAPRSLNDRVPRDLETIALKCLQKDAAKRYPTATQLAADLHRYLAGEAILARPTGRLELGWRWVRRNRGLTSAAAITSLLLTAVAAISTVSAVRIDAARTVAIQERERAGQKAQEAESQRQRAESEAQEAKHQRQRAESEAEAARAAEAQAVDAQTKTERALKSEAEQSRIAAARASEARRSSYLAKITSAQQAWKQGNGGQTLAILQNLTPRQGEDNWCGFEYYHLWGLCHDKIQELIGHTESVSQLVFSPDGSRIASSSYDDSVRLWDLPNLKPLSILIGHQTDVECVAFSHDGRLLASGGDAKQPNVIIWDAHTGKEISRVKAFALRASCLQFSLDDRVLYAAGRNDIQVISLSDPSEMQLKKEWKASQKIQGIALAPNTNALAVAEGNGSRAGLVEIFDAESGERRSQIPHSSTVTCVAFNSDGNQLVTATLDHRITVWDAREAKLIRALSGHTGTIRSVSFSPDDKKVVSSGHDRKVLLHDLESGDLIQAFQAHSDAVLSATYSPQGDQVASAGRDHAVRLWSPRELQGHESLQPVDGAGDAAANSYFGSVYQLGYSDNGQLCAWTSTTLPGRITVIDAVTKKAVRTLSLSPGDSLLGVAVSPDGATVAAGSGSVFAIGLPGKQQSQLHFWDLATGNLIASVGDFRNGILGVAFSPDGNLVATAGGDGVVRLWDAKSHEQLAELTGHQQFATAVAFSPDGKLLASTGAQDRKLRIWNVAERRLSFALEADESLLAVAFSPDGRFAAASGGQISDMDVAGKVWLWDLATQKLVREPYRAHISFIRGLAFSPDGDRLASAGAEGIVKLLDVESGVEVASFENHSKICGSIAFSPDGSELAAGTESNTVKVWRATGNLQTSYAWQSRQMRRCLEQGKRQEAIPFLDAMVALRPQDVATIFERAQCKYWLGDLDGAIADLAHARSIDHADELTRMLGKWREAMDRESSRLNSEIKDREALRKHWENGCKFVELGLGEEHIFTTNTIAEAANVLWHQVDDRTRAQELYERVIPRWAALLGEGIRDVTGSYLDLARAYFSGARNAETLLAYRTLTSAVSAVRPEESNERAKLLNGLALVLHADGKFDEAVERLREAIALCGKADPEQDTGQELLIYYAQLESILLQLGRIEEANEVAMESSRTISRPKLTTTIPVADPLLLAKSATAAGRVHGVVAEMFSGANFEHLIKSRIDERIDYLSVSQPLDAEMPEDSFSVRWTGWLRAPKPGRYVLTAFSDDGLRLWIDGSLRIDRWDLCSYSAKAIVDFGSEPVPIQMEWNDTGGYASALLRWRAATETHDYPIPATAFVLDPTAKLPSSPALHVDPNRVTTGLNAQYFAGFYFDRLVAERIDSELDWFIGFNMPIGGAPLTHFSVNWDGWLVPPAAGDYKFIVAADNAVKMTINDEDLLDQWYFGTRYKEFTLPLNRSPAKFSLNYSNNGAPSFVRITWELEGKVGPQPIPANCFFPSKDAASEHINRSMDKDDVQRHDSIISPSNWPAPRIRTSDYFALRLRGRNDRITIPTLILDGTSPYTIEVVASESIVDKTVKTLIGNFTDTPNPAGLGIQSINGSWKSTFQADGWRHAVSDFAVRREIPVHLAAVFDGQFSRLFVNGRLQSIAVTTPHKHLASPLPLIIGGDHLPQNAFDGNIEEVRISRGVRYSANFVPQLRMDADENAIALYHFDEGQGVTIHDSTPNHHDGIMNGCEWVDLRHLKE